MKAAIIGTGFLGQQVYEDILPNFDKVILTHNKNQKYPDSKKFDIFTDDIEDILDGEKPDVIFFTAKVEFTQNEELLAEVMEKFLKKTKGSRIVYISSDGIFDGQKGMYKESDEPNPVTLYGRNLKTCEEFVKKYAENYCIVRPGYMYGYVGGVLDGRFEKVKEETAEGKSIVRYAEMYKSPLSYKQSSEAIVKIAGSDFVGTVHVCGPRTSVYDFTKEGMKALHIPTENLGIQSVPEEKPVDYLPDNSLDNSLMQELTGIKPLGVEESFEKFYRTEINKEINPKPIDPFQRIR